MFDGMCYLADIALSLIEKYGDESLINAQTLPKNAQQVQVGR
jgi:hypothetical protein